MAGANPLVDLVLGFGWDLLNFRKILVLHTMDSICIADNYLPGGKELPEQARMATPKNSCCVLVFCYASPIVLLSLTVNATINRTYYFYGKGVELR
jgi:hypothetical protein